LPMWEEDLAKFATKYQLTARQARQLRSTSEHLLARCDGGDDSRSNIVAAYSRCNRLRHRPKVPKSPNVWRAICLKRVARIYSVEQLTLLRAHHSNCARSRPEEKARDISVNWPCKVMHRNAKSATSTTVTAYFLNPERPNPASDNSAYRHFGEVIPYWGTFSR
jgi:hypothetical protein